MASSSNPPPPPPPAGNGEAPGVTKEDRSKVGVGESNEEGKSNAGEINDRGEPRSEGGKKGKRKSEKKKKPLEKKKYEEEVRMRETLLMMAQGLENQHKPKMPDAGEGIQRSLMLGRCWGWGAKAEFKGFIRGYGQRNKNEEDAGEIIDDGAKFRKTAKAENARCCGGGFKGA